MMQKTKENFVTTDSLDFEEPLLSLPDKVFYFFFCIKIFLLKIMIAT